MTDARMAIAALAILVFAALYAALSLSRDQRLLPAGADPGAAVGGASLAWNMLSGYTG